MLEAAGDSVLAVMRAGLDGARAAVAGIAPVRVLYLIGTEPPMVAGPGTFVDDLIAIAGGRNAFGDLQQLWPQVSLEEIVRRQPDVIIRPGSRQEELASLRERTGWRELRAVREGRVHLVDADLYNRPGATVGRAARGLAERIHAPPQ